MSVDELAAQTWRARLFGRSPADELRTDIAVCVLLSGLFRGGICVSDSAEGQSLAKPFASRRVRPTLFGPSEHAGSRGATQ